MSSDAFSADSWPVAIRVPPADRRDGQRKWLRVQARICVDGETPLEAHTIDLSHHGVSITSPQQLNEGVGCAIELGSGAHALAAPPALRAEVRYCTRLCDGQFRIGMRFTSVSIEAAELILAVLGT
jgi:hypothetical protein